MEQDHALKVEIPALSGTPELKPPAYLPNGHHGELKAPVYLPNNMSMNNYSTQPASLAALNTPAHYNPANYYGAGNPISGNYVIPPTKSW